MTPFLLACGAGLADVVLFLIDEGIDANHVDYERRGALQLAIGTKTDWLVNEIKIRPPALELTYGKGRTADRKVRGGTSLSYPFRVYRKKGAKASNGYEPTVANTS